MARLVCLVLAARLHLAVARSLDFARPLESPSWGAESDSFRSSSGRELVTDRNRQLEGSPVDPAERRTERAGADADFNSELQESGQVLGASFLQAATVTVAHSRSWSWPWESSWGSVGGKSAGNITQAQVASSTVKQTHPQFDELHVAAAGDEDEETSASDNPSGAVINVKLNSELQESGRVVEAASFLQVASLDAARSASFSWPWESAWDSDDGKRVENSTHAQVEGSQAKRADLETEKLHLAPGGSEVTKTSASDNPSGAVINVKLSSELQESGRVVEASFLQVASLDTARSAGFSWPWEAAWASAGDVSPGDEAQLEDSTAKRAQGNGAENSTHAQVEGATAEQHTALGGGKDDDTSFSGNPNGAVVNVKLNSELQESGREVQPSFLQAPGGISDEMR